MADKAAAGPRVTKLGRYEVLNELGKGAMGIVYLAKDPVIGRMVAIKTIRTASFGDDDSESREFRERFIREAQTAGILSHPNIVTIHDIGEDPETKTSFIAMEYIEGRNVKSLLAERTAFGYEQIADIIAQVAEAIDYAHRKGIIHRDIKPANIIMTTDGKVKIMDFGIAKIASSNLTTTGQFLGTPNYMSPEQVSGAAVDGRSDIFSLGVVLYEMLTNRKPFQGENLTAISYKIVHEEFTPPAELSPEVPPDFNPIVARAMAKDPWNRYQRGKDFALALHQLKARLEEQRALRDLGTMVSAAENMPTLRLENLEKLVAEAAKAQGQGGLAAAMRPPEADRSDWTEDSGAVSGQRVTPPPAPASKGETTAPVVVSAAAGPVPAAPVAEDARAKAPPAPPDRPSAELRTRAIPILANLPAPPEEEPEPSAAPPPPAFPDALSAPAPPERASGTARRTAEAGEGLPRPAAAAGAAPAAEVMRARLLAAWTDSKRLLKAEVNPPWFWGAAAAAALFLVVVLAAGFFKVHLVSRPTVPPVDPAVMKEMDQRKRALEEGKKLFAAGEYERSLALLRQVLAKNPGNQQARQYAQMAENALQGRAVEAQKSQEAERSLEAARAAFDQKNYQEVVRRADETLALDGGRVEAQQLKDQALAKIAENEAAAREEARRKREARRLQARRRPTPVREARAVRPSPVPTAVAAAGPAILRLLFNSPLSEGNVMIYVNDQKVLQRQFDFSRKSGFFRRVEGTGTVEASMPVRGGPVAVKIWLSGKGLPAAAYATVNGQINGGETRILRLDYAGGRLSARIQ